MESANYASYKNWTGVRVWHFEMSRLRFTSCRLEHYKKREKRYFDVHLDAGMEQPLDEHADETLLSQASQISVPEKEVSICLVRREGNPK
ncbi:unnamed protein product [Porites evermanni]|uniref:Uncharacterized protein n=1 Tax=Porites evermanni TaxID=104178 RepID=A0ABN8PQB9_9CNID|nr:unnamed protein product [Porites evermanni]